MPAPSPSTKPSRSRSKGREALVGSSLRVLRAVSRLKPVTPKGWIMVCVPPASITSASPRRMISTASPTAWLLAAQAVRQLTFGPWALNRLARWPAGMFGSCSSSAMGCSVSSPLRVNLARSKLVAAVEAGDHHLGEAVEILLAFAAAGVDAEAGGIELAEIQARVGHGLLGGADGEVGVPALVLPIVRVLAHVGEVPVADFGGDFGGEVAGVEERGIADARLAVEQPPPDRFDVRAQRRDAAHAGDHNASSHQLIPLSITSNRRQVQCIRNSEGAYPSRFDHSHETSSSSPCASLAQFGLSRRSACSTRQTWR